MDRIHQTTSNDGTTIAGYVYGEGPPLVLIHGGLEDGDQCWEAMLPHLTEHFTCYVMSRRSRGLSDESNDLTPGRLLEDVSSFVESVAQQEDGPLILFAESDGGPLALGAAAQHDSVAAVAVYEPTVFEVIDENTASKLQRALPKIGEAVSEGRLVDGARMFSEMVANSDELKALSEAGYLEEAARYIPVLLQEFQQSDESDDPSPTRPSVLSQITIPTLILRGKRSCLAEWFADGARYIAEHVSGAQERQIEGAGHFGVVLHPEAITHELLQFLGTALPQDVTSRLSGAPPV
jgi:pimeloyl-ACP methyl ester carboxylesterase